MDSSQERFGEADLEEETFRLEEETFRCAESVERSIKQKAFIDAPAATMSSSQQHKVGDDVTPTYRSSWSGEAGHEEETWFLNDGPDAKRSIEQESAPKYRDLPWLEGGEDEPWFLDEATVTEPAYRSLKLAPSPCCVSSEMGRMALTHPEEQLAAKKVASATTTAALRAIPAAVLLTPYAHCFFTTGDLHAAHRAVADALTTHEDVDIAKYSASKAKWSVIVYAPAQPERAANLRVCLFASKGVLALDVQRRKGDATVAARAYYKLRTMLAALSGVTPCDAAGLALSESALQVSNMEYRDCIEPPPLRCPIADEYALPPPDRDAFEPLWQMLVSPFRDVVVEGTKALASAVRDADARKVLAEDLKLLQRLLELATTSTTAIETRRCAVCTLCRLWCEPAAIQHAAKHALVDLTALRALVDLAAGRGGEDDGASLQSAEELMTRRLCAQILQRFCAQGFWAVFFDTRALAQAGLKQVEDSSQDARLIQIVRAAQCDMMACAH